MKFHDERILPVNFFNVMDRQKYFADDFGQKTDNAKRIKQRTMSITGQAILPTGEKNPKSKHKTFPSAKWSTNLGHPPETL